MTNACTNSLAAGLSWWDLGSLVWCNLCLQMIDCYPCPMVGIRKSKLILKRVGNCLGKFFSSLGNFFWISGSHHFPCYLQHFGAGNCHFHGMCNGFEFEPLIFHCIFHGICNSLQHVLSIFHAFAAFLSWNLHFHRMCNILQLHSSQYLQDFGAEGWHSNSCLLLLLLLLVLVLLLVVLLLLVVVVVVLLLLLLLLVLMLVLLVLC